MSKITITLIVITSLLSSSCSTTRKSITFGIGTGAITGATIGAMSNRDQSKGAMMGLGIGALVGGLASYFIHGSLVDRDSDTRKDTLFNLEKHGVFGESPEETKAQSRWHDREFWPREHMGGRH
jgi:hypothetical protein